MKTALVTAIGSFSADIVNGFFSLPIPVVKRSIWNSSSKSVYTALQSIIRMSPQPRFFHPIYFFNKESMI